MVNRLVGRERSRKVFGHDGAAATYPPARLGVGMVRLVDVHVALAVHPRLLLVALRLERRACLRVAVTLDPAVVAVAVAVTLAVALTAWDDAGQPPLALERNIYLWVSVSSP